MPSVASAFDDLVDHIIKHKIYNPRPQVISRVLSRGIIKDLIKYSKHFREHIKEGIAVFRTDLRLTKDGKSHTIDLALGLRKKSESRTKRKPLSIEIDGESLIVYNEEPLEFTLFLENKSIITAHRNKRNRTRDLESLASFLPKFGEDPIKAATMIIGTAERYLNVDRLKWAEDALDLLCKERNSDISIEGIRESMGQSDQTLIELLKDEKIAELFCSKNKTEDPQKTMETVISEVPLKPDSQEGFDAIAIQFLSLDNIHTPTLVTPDYFSDEKYRRYHYNEVIDLLAKEYDRCFK